MQQVNIEQAKINLAVLIDAALNGEEVVIETEKKAVKLVPLHQNKPQPKFGSAKGLIEIGDDFDEPLEEFADYR